MLRLLLCLVTLFVATPLRAEPAELALFIWPDYIDRDVLTAFQRETGITVHLVTYESDDLKDDMMVSTQGEGLDMIIGTAQSMQSYKKKGWIAPLDAAAMPHVRHVDPRWETHFPGLSTHAVPYFWGTIGIAWRKDLIKKPVDSWQALLKPDESLRGRILMLNDSADLVAVALKSLGYSMMSDRDPELTAAEALLMAQKPYVSRYGYEELSEKASLISGQNWISAVYNGDGLYLKSLDPRIEFVVPREGTAIWLDEIAVLSASTRRAEAMRFIDYINRPAVAARLSESLMFASPNLEAKKHVAPAILNDASIYPTDAVLRHSEVMAELPSAQVLRRNAITATVMH
jgi:spermidine/putrescine transport system substrate-binding protein